MKIEYRTPPGTGDYTVLADESVETLAARITGYQPVMRKSPQLVGLFRSASAPAYDRGNQVWSLRFGVERVHESAAAALAYLATHAAVFAGVANLDLKITVGASVLNLAGCALQEFTPAPQSDLSTFIVYGFVGPTYAS